jgi:murein DD-endopeptidase MepM/ murein hydrolase activator NlpD
MAKYKIKSGDSLSKIAKMMGTTVAAIMKANKNIKDKNKIKAGDSLTLPMGASADGGKAAYDKKYPKSKEKAALNIIKNDTNNIPKNEPKSRPKSITDMRTKDVKMVTLKSGKMGTIQQRLAEIDTEKKMDAKKEGMKNVMALAKKAAKESQDKKAKKANKGMLIITIGAAKKKKSTKKKKA